MMKNGWCLKICIIFSYSTTIPDLKMKNRWSPTKLKANDSTTRHRQVAVDTKLHWTCCTCLMCLLWMVCEYAFRGQFTLICLIVDAWICCYLILHFLFQVGLCHQIVTQIDSLVFKKQHHPHQYFTKSTISQ